ncbi:MAG: Ig-like domain-containing protein [Promethearchaeota archaeon]
MKKIKNSKSRLLSILIVVTIASGVLIPVVSYYEDVLGLEESDCRKRVLPSISIDGLEDRNSVKGIHTLSTSLNDNADVAAVDYYIDGILVKRDDMAPFTYEWDTTRYKEGKHEIKVVARDSSDNSNSQVNSYATSMDVTVDNVAEKIAAFFYASNVFNYILEDITFTILLYANILKLEGYTIFYNFLDGDYGDNIQIVDDYEGSSDTVFFYLWGHGEYCTTYKKPDSIIELKPGNDVRSSKFREEWDNLDASKKCIIVESCFSGGWVEDFNDDQQLVMSASDTLHVGNGVNSQQFLVALLPIWPKPLIQALTAYGEGVFSFLFFRYVAWFGLDAVSAFLKTKLIFLNPALFLIDFVPFYGPLTPIILALMQIHVHNPNPLIGGNLQELFFV